MIFKIANLINEVEFGLTNQREGNKETPQSFAKVVNLLQKNQLLHSGKNYLAIGVNHYMARQILTGL